MRSLKVGAHDVEVRPRVIVEIANPGAELAVTGPWIRSYRAVDRRFLITVVDAADAASVEAMYRAAGIAIERAWTTYEYEEVSEPVPQTTVVVVTDYDRPLSDPDNIGKAERVFACLDARATGAWARSYLATDRRRMVCEFQGRDTESIREALHTANVAFGIAWRADKLERVTAS